MDRFAEVLAASTLADAATVLVAASGSPLTVWVAPPGGARTCLAGDAGARGPGERIASAGGTVIEVVGSGEDRVAVEIATVVLAAVADRLDAQRAAERSAAQHEALFHAAPDAIVVVDGEGRVASVNPQAEELFAAPAHELVGIPVDDLVPDDVREAHGVLRAGYLRDPATRPMAAGTDLYARRRDGSLVPVDIGLSPLPSEPDLTVAAFVRDATPRRQAEADRNRIAASELRRRHAVQLNDDVVQGLVELLWQLDPDRDAALRQAAADTLAAARRMMSDLLRDSVEPIGPGSLVRDQPSRVSSAVRHGPEPPAPPADGSEQAARVSVVIADDVPSVRQLLRLELAALSGVRVVAEAADGAEAVAVALAHRPDVVLLDLGMPVLDGFEVTRRIKDELPGTRVFVLSGYPAEVMREQALAAGADDYFEKRADLLEVCEAITGLLRPV